MRISPSAEAFLTLRAECGKSLAVSSLFGYILGLGDRHLDNLLLDEATGGIVQIDFGVCFGMGTSVLHVPELMPFRLTRQLTGLFQPLQGTPLLRHYMIRVLGAIRWEVPCCWCADMLCWLLTLLCCFLSSGVLCCAAWWCCAGGAGRRPASRC